MAEITMEMTNYQISNIKRAAAEFERSELYRNAIRKASEFENEFLHANERAGSISNNLLAKYREMYVSPSAQRIDAVTELICSIFNYGYEEVHEDIMEAVSRL